jgi:hypothetical protein
MAAGVGWWIRSGSNRTAACGFLDLLRASLPDPEMQNGGPVRGRRLFVRRLIDYGAEAGEDF